MAESYEDQPLRFCLLAVFVDIVAKLSVPPEIPEEKTARIVPGVLPVQHVQMRPLVSSAHWVVINFDYFPSAGFDARPMWRMQVYPKYGE